MTKTTTCIYHFLVLNWYVFLNCYIPNIGKDNEKLKELHDGGRWKYLTLLNLAIFFGVACLDDVLKRIRGRKNIKFITSFRDLLFTTLAFPVSTFVFLVFWGLFCYDRSLVYPKDLDDFFPAWVNHAMTEMWGRTRAETTSMLKLQKGNWRKAKLDCDELDRAHDPEP
ncbi:hypothetical protein ACRRTK_018366 [Alexandromys fortis]